MQIRKSHWAVVSLDSLVRQVVLCSQPVAVIKDWVAVGWSYFDGVHMLFTSHTLLSCTVPSLSPMCLHPVVCLRVCVCLCAPWCPIMINNHPTVMREMRFPLNNGRPVRFADPLNLSGCRTNTSMCTRPDRHTLLARLSSSAHIFKCTRSLRLQTHADGTFSLCCCLFVCLPEQTLITEANHLSVMLFCPELNYWTVGKTQLNTDYFPVREQKKLLHTVKAPSLSLVEMIVIILKWGRAWLTCFEFQRPFSCLLSQSWAITIAACPYMFSHGSHIGFYWFIFVHIMSCRLTGVLKHVSSLPECYVLLSFPFWGGTPKENWHLCHVLFIIAVLVIKFTCTAKQHTIIAWNLYPNIFILTHTLMKQQFCLQTSLPFFQ